MILSRHTTIQLKIHHNIQISKEKNHNKKLTLYSILHLQKYMLLPSQWANLKNIYYTISITLMGQQNKFQPILITHFHDQLFFIK